MVASHPLPQVRLFQTFATLAAATDRDRRAWLIGPSADLHRFNIDAERAGIAVGDYDPAVSTAYAWPGRATGSVVDQASVRIFVKDAKLRYLRELRGSGSTTARVSGRTNEIRNDTLAFRSVTGSARSAVLGDRDVQIGDSVTITGTSSGTTSTLRTYVRGFAAEPVAASVGSLVNGSANAASQTVNTTTSQSGGTVNRVRIAADLTDYNPLIAGVLNDTFTVTVIQGSVGGDLTTGRVRVQSASGLDYVASWAPPAVDATAEVGTRKLKLGFTLAVGGSGVDLVVGQVFTVAVEAAWTAPTLASAGTYTGSSSTTYVIEVIQGGLIADTDTTKRPRIAVRTSNGADGNSSLAVLSTAALAIGTQGVQLTLTGVAGLRKGDTYSIPVTAATTGRVSTLILGHELNATLLAATDLDLELAIVADVEIPRYQSQPSPRVCWTPAATNVTLVNDIQVFHSSWTVDGAAVALPVVGGTVHVQYREWLAALADTLTPVTTTADLDNIPGPLDPDNPLKWHAAKTIGNANASVVYLTAVANPSDLDSWTAALRPGTDVEDVYNVVPITEWQDAIDLIVSHVNSQSGPGVNQFRRAIVGLPLPLTSPVVDSTLSTNAQPVLATIGDEPTITGTQYLRVTATSGNIAFDTIGVRAGDLLRIGFNTDPTGAVTYREYVIDAIVSATALRLVSGPEIPLGVAERMEVHRVHNRSELIAAIGARAAAYGSRRVSAVFVNTTEIPVGRRSTTVAAAAVAGLASGIAPHQALTNVTLSDLDELFAADAARVRFTRTELEQLAGYGVHIVDRNAAGEVYSAEGLTTDMSDINRNQEMIQRNLDNISRRTILTIRPYVGRANLVPATLAQMRADLTGLYESLRGPDTALVGIGAQIVEYTIQALRADLFQRDKLIINVDFLLPYAINRIDATLQVV